MQFKTLEKANKTFLLKKPNLVKKWVFKTCRLHLTFISLWSRTKNTLWESHWNAADSCASTTRQQPGFNLEAQTNYLLHIRSVLAATRCSSPARNTFVKLKMVRFCQRGVDCEATTCLYIYGKIWHPFFLHSFGMFVLCCLQIKFKTRVVWWCSVHTIQSNDTDGSFILYLGKKTQR